jgi:hypothetical protein
MAYGIEVIGEDSNGTYLVTDSSKDLINYVVVAKGTGTSVNLTSTQGLKPLVFIKPPTGATLTDTLYGCQFASGNLRTFKKATLTYTSQNNSVTIGNLSDATMDYFVVKDMTGITYSGTDTYGIQVLTANGDVAVDSRRFLTNDTFTISNIKGARTVSGNNGQIYFDGSTRRYVNSEFTQMFVAGSGIDREEQVQAIKWMTNQARFYGYYNDVSFGPGNGGSTMYFNNFSTIMSAQLR